MSPAPRRIPVYVVLPARTLLLDVAGPMEALRKANDWLLNEVVQRQQAQEQLQASQAALSEQQKAELKGRLKDVMSRLMQRDQSGAAMQELYVLRRCALPALFSGIVLGSSTGGGGS